LGEKNKAIIEYQTAISVNPNSAQAYNNLAIIYKSLQKHDKAELLIKKSITLAPLKAGAYVNLGSILLEQGKNNEAADSIRKAIQLQPKNIRFWSKLANCFTFTSTANEIAQKLLHFEDKLNTKSTDVSFLYFALGKIFKDCGAFEQSYKYYKKANKIQDKSVNYPPKRIENIFKDNKDFFTSSRLNITVTEIGQSTLSPVFVVGLPRTGKTLIESILSNHPSIGALGEYHMIQNIISRLNQNNNYPQCLMDLNDSDKNRLSQEYVNYQNSIAKTNSIMTIDTMGSNSLHLGFIYTLFPNAKIIWCERDTLDCSLHNFFKCFRSGYEYSYNLKNLAHYISHHQKCMNYWNQTIPSAIYKVNYDDLILDTKNVMININKFLGINCHETITPAIKLKNDEINISGKYPEFTKELERHLKQVRL